MSSPKKRQANALVHETSPYLLQHAYNPVQWLPYSEEAFARAKRENRLVLISVGYSACHWCHVMERESFEDEQVADMMNAHFVCVKVDREERPDVDMLYMNAVQLMTGHGGWPMNCFVLPDGRPCYGGTYFNKTQWMQILGVLADLQRTQPDKVEKYATELTQGIRRTEEFFERPAEQKIVGQRQLVSCVDKWSARFDNRQGGGVHAPKFPMPSNYTFLMRYARLSGDNSVKDHVDLTLKKMAFGGIYDQVHGGFARYSVDVMWKVPHFEKMLYDNAQLASLYGEASALHRNPLYAAVAKDILSFVQREWLTPEGGFLSAYDADSEGVEGKYYVWSKEELERVLGEDYPLFARYYLIDERGYWEDGNYILMRNPEFHLTPSMEGETAAGNAAQIAVCLEKLRRQAAHRVKPSLDDKIVCSWNAMICTGFARCALYLDEPGYAETALAGVRFLWEKLRDEDGHLLRTYKNGKARIRAFLEDYAFLAEAMLWCYYSSGDEKLLELGSSLVESALDLFNNENSVFLSFTSRLGEQLLTRSTDISDNVIPSSNSAMAHMLFAYGHLLGKQEWIDRSASMLSAVSGEMLEHGGAYSNWASLALMMAWPLKEVAVVGKDVNEISRALFSSGITNTIFAVSSAGSDLPLLRDRFVNDKTMIYVCEDKTCDLPVETVEDALERLD